MTTTVTLDFRDAATLVRHLQTFAARALPYAIRNGLNASAFEGRKLWARELQDTFTLRNQFTTRSLRVERVQHLRVAYMEAVLGSVAPYMATQELGGTETGRTGAAKPIPTAVAAGQPMGTRPRTRTVRRPNWLSVIKLARNRKRVGNRKQQNAIALSEAVRSGRKFVYLELENRKGLFRVTGKRKLNIRMVWDLTRKTTRTPREPTLQRSLVSLGPRLPGIQVGAILAQLKRNHVLGYR